MCCQDFVRLTFCYAFSCKLLISNNIGSRAIWCKLALTNFQRLQIALTLRACTILLSLKIYSCLLTPNWTRNHVMTCTKYEDSEIFFRNGNHNNKSNYNFTLVRLYQRKDNRFCFIFLAPSVFSLFASLSFKDCMFVLFVCS